MLADLHCHTIFSGHAFSTLEENVLAARRRGIEVLGISDHGPSMEGACYAGHFEMGPRLPKEYHGLKLLFGCEANVINFDGDLDLSTPTLSKLDYLIIGLHLRTPFPARSTIRQNTLALVRAMRRHRVQILAHPFTYDFPVELGQIVEVARQNSVALELNLSRLRQILKNSVAQRSVIELEATQKMIKLAVSQNVPVICGSDAHHVSELGCNAGEQRQISDMIGFEVKKFFLNNNPDLLRRLLSKI